MSFHLLVIDDNPDHRFLVQRALRGMPVELAFAEDGQQGLDAIAARAPDLVLLDIKMPRVDGFEVLQRLRADHPRTIQVVVFSSSENARDQARATELGADGFVTKPLDAAAFQHTVRETVEARRRA